MEEPASRSEARVALVTHPRAGAREFARGLVEARVAACVNLLEAASVFRWEGRVEVEEEVLLVIKTVRSNLAALERSLAEGHPYDVPECVVLEPERVEQRYLAWLLDETRPSSGDR